MFEQAPVAIAVLRGKSYVIELANPAACRIWGRAQNDVVNRPLFEALPECAGQGLEGLLEGVLATGTPHVGKDLRIRVARAKGGGLEDVYFDFVYQPMRDATGRVEGILVVANEVTESVRARQMVETAREVAEAARAKLHSLLMQAPVALCILEVPSRVVVAANPAYRALVGGRDVVGKGLLEAFPRIQGEDFESVMERVVTTGEPFVGNEVPARLDRTGTGQLEDAFFNFILTPERNAAGQVDGILASAADVTEPVRARQRVAALAQRLRESDERLRRVVEASGTGTWEVDMATGGLTGDARFSDLMGLPSGTPLTLEAGIEALHAEDRGRFRTILVAAVGGENEGRYSSVHRIAGPAGAPERWLEARGQALFEGTGTPVRLVGTVVDVTARKHAEAFERQLIGIVSHDLRDPLSAILLGVTVLRSGGLNARNTKTALRIETSAERAARMIRDLLDFTQARLGGGIRVMRRCADLHTLTLAVMEEVKLAHPGREVRVTREGDGRGEWDEDRLQQVVRNLVTNALKYSPEDTPVGVQTRGEDEWVALSVHNAGTHIPFGQLGRLFEPLQRATRAAVHDEDRSVGLGLYIVKEIAIAHGGTVEVSSSAAEGTLFTVRLPRGSKRP